MLSPACFSINATSARSVFHIRLANCILFLWALCSAQTGSQEQIYIAVSGFKSGTFSKAEALAVEIQFTDRLINSGVLNVVERSQMEEILKEQGMQQTGCTSQECAVEIGQLIGVQQIIVGALDRLGSYIILSAKVLDVRTGEIITNQTEKIKGDIDDLVEYGIANLADAIVHHFDSSHPVVTRGSGDQETTNTGADGILTFPSGIRANVQFGGGTIAVGGIRGYLKMFLFGVNSGVAYSPTTDAVHSSLATIGSFFTTTKIVRPYGCGNIMYMSDFKGGNGFAIGPAVGVYITRFFFTELNLYYGIASDEFSPRLTLGATL